jgi:hypothetical protein
LRYLHQKENKKFEIAAASEKKRRYFLKAIAIEVWKYAPERFSMVVHIPGRMQALINLFVSILKWGTER